MANLRIGARSQPMAVYNEVICTERLTVEDTDLFKNQITEYPWMCTGYPVDRSVDDGKLLIPRSCPMTDDLMLEETMVSISISKVCAHTFFLSRMTLLRLPPVVPLKMRVIITKRS